MRVCIVPNVAIVYPPPLNTFPDSISCLLACWHRLWVLALPVSWFALPWLHSSTLVDYIHWITFVRKGPLYLTESTRTTWHKFEITQLTVPFLGLRAAIVPLETRRPQRIVQDRSHPVWGILAYQPVPYSGQLAH